MKEHEAFGASILIEFAKLNSDSCGPMRSVPKPHIETFYSANDLHDQTSVCDRSDDGHGPSQESSEFLYSLAVIRVPGPVAAFRILHCYFPSGSQQRGTR